MDSGVRRAGLVPVGAGGGLPRVLVLGGSCLSVLVHTYAVPGRGSVDGVHTHTAVGCMGPGKALSLLRLGFPTVLHTVVGDDQPGAHVRDLLAGQGLDVVYDIDPAGTNTHVNVMDPRGGRHGIPIIVASREPPVDLARLEASVATADVVVLNPHGFCRRALPAIRRCGTPVWADLGDFEPGNDYFDQFRAGADVVTMSGTRVANQRAMLEELICEGKQLAVVTNGRSGSIAMDQTGMVIHTPAVPDVAMVDSNGAGDSFHAGLLYAIATGRPVAEALRVAATVASLTVSSLDLVHPDLSPALVEHAHRTCFADR